MDWGINYEGTLPSGVAFELSEILTEDQDKLITTTSKGLASQAFTDLLLSKLERLGDKKKGEITRAMVAGMLDADMKFALLKLHTHSFEDEEDFSFSVEFPIEEGEKEKVVEKHSVNLTTFDVVPYKWVRDYMEEEEREQYIERSAHSFPAMYESYESMLKENLERTWKIETRAGEKEVKYKLLTANALKATKSLTKGKGDFISMLYMREAKVATKIQAEGQESTVWQAMQWEKVPAKIQERFRREFMAIEGRVDSTVTVQSSKNPRKSKTIDLLATGEFYSPSLAQ